MMSPKELYKNHLLRKLEDEIALFLGYQIWNDAPERLIEVLAKEMHLAYLTPDEILVYFSQNIEKVKCFSGLFLPETNPYEDPPFLSRGFVVSHAIYMIYLEHRTTTEMQQYMKRRQLPRGKEFVKSLKEIWVNVK